MLADRDPLTGCVNRRGFDKLAVREVARSDRFGQPLPVRVLDIDRFRQVNDSYDESTAMAAAKRLRLAIAAAAVSTIKGDCG